MGKTVTTYLIDGDSKETQYAFISNKICQMFVVPRSNLAYLNTQEKLQKPAFYILLGEDEATKPQAYIGETENFRERVKDHDSKKSFWQKALIFVSKDVDMTKAGVQYLEHQAIAEAKKANAFVLSDNKQTPKALNLPEYQQNSMDGFFEDIKFLDSLSAAISLRYRSQKQNIYSILNGVVVKRRASIVPSPSTVADFCRCSNNNGWLVWKDKEGNTLDSVYEKNWNYEQI